MPVLFKQAGLVVAIVLLTQPFLSAHADTEPSKQGFQSASINPFAPRPASVPAAVVAVPQPAASTLPMPVVPPSGFAPAKLPPLPLPPSPGVPLPSFDDTGHAAGGTVRPESEAANVIGRARQAANCHLSLPRKEATVRGAGGTVVLNFASRTARDCAKAAMPDVDWIDVANLGDHSVTFEIKENESGASREGHVRLVSPDVGDAINVTITQKSSDEGGGK
jgi:hypothetical protein